MLKQTKSSKVTSSHLKQLNEALVLRAIYTHKAVSRVRLAQLTHLSRPSITELTQGLIARGLVTEEGLDQEPHKVGKKPQLLTFNADAYQMIAVVLNDTSIICALLNLRGVVIERESVPMNGAKSTQLIDSIRNQIGTMQQKATQPLLGVTIGTPGIVDSFTGVVHLAANLEWKDLPLGKLLRKEFELPVCIGNDSNLAVIAEHNFGTAKGVTDLIVVKIGVGIGVGILSDGRVIHGSTYSAGELGHNAFLATDDLCVCGRRGCLETLVSWWGLSNHAQQIIRDHPDSLLNKLLIEGKGMREALQMAFHLGDPYLVELVNTAARTLGRALTIVVHLLNPKQIILTGSMVQLGEPFIREVRRTIHEFAFPYLTSEIDILANEHDDHLILLGACALLLETELGL